MLKSDTDCVWKLLKKMKSKHLPVDSWST